MGFREDEARASLNRVFERRGRKLPLADLVKYAFKATQPAA